MAKRKKRIRRPVAASEDLIHRAHGGGQGVLWVQDVQIRDKSQRQPMETLARFRSQLFHHSPLTAEEIAHRETEPRAPPADNDSNDDDDEEDYDDDEDEVDEKNDDALRQQRNGNGTRSERKQYTVRSSQYRNFIVRRILGNAWVDVDEYSFTPGRLFMRYINWTFEASFFTVFLSFLTVFMGLTLFFAVLLLAAGNSTPECIVVGGEQFGTNPDTKFSDVFGLSWTTLATVGYGMTYTATGATMDRPKDCTVVVLLCTAEAFVGLIYAGMGAAIMFGKVGRVQSHAQVVFSNAVCIEYGIEAEDEHDGDDKNDIDPVEQLNDLPRNETLPPKTPRILCPLMKFQVVNELCNRRGGEIMDAFLKVVAANNHSNSKETHAIARYYKVELMELEHPFFNRVWHGRHSLNASSPILSPHARSMIRRNGGYWPADWNTPEKVREHLRFTDVMVILTGISNVSASTVHSYKKYKIGDVLIGYDFATVLYKHPETNRLKVDMSLKHDVIEQRGAKPLKWDDSDSSIHMTHRRRSH